MLVAADDGRMPYSHHRKRMAATAKSPRKWHAVCAVFVSKSSRRWLENEEASRIPADLMADLLNERVDLDDVSAR